MRHAMKVMMFVKATKQTDPAGADRAQTVTG
jgi:hypothetical protein